jgi:hypothetical protein
MIATMLTCVIIEYIKPILKILPIYDPKTYTQFKHYLSSVARHSPEGTKFIDKFCFFVSCFIVITTTYLLGVSPSKYFLYWIGVIWPLLLGKRFLMFLRIGYAYYFLDFCYVCNLAIYLFVFMFPGSQFWYTLAFSLTSVSNALFILKNSMVFHDIDKITGWALHYFPLLAMWNIHVNIEGTQGKQDWGFYQMQNHGFDLDRLLSFFAYFGWFYVFWCILNFSILFIYWKKIILSGQYCNMLNEMIRGTFVKETRLKYGNTVAKFAYLIQHMNLMKTMILFYIPVLFWKYFFTFCMIGYTCLIFTRAGIYYIDIFSENYKSYLKQVEEDGPLYDPLKMRPEGDISTVLKECL